MEASKLNLILEQHRLWIDTDRVQGTRAKLRNVDLRNVDLRGANLVGANLITKRLEL